MRYFFFVFIFVCASFAQMPEDAGPYQVGCRLDTLIRMSSIDTTMRQMVVYTWYPADPVVGYWVEEVRAYWGARPVQGDTARPVVVFSHGGCGHPLASVYYTSHTASWGFIVISTMHPGSMYGDPDCLDSASLHDTWLNRPDDVQYTIDSIFAMTQENPALIGVMDTSRMGMSGHSFGARTTYAVCNRQNWAKCAVAMSGNYVDRWDSGIYCMDDVRGVNVPIILLNGSYDQGLDTPHMLEIFDTVGVPKYAVEIARAGHFTFSDTCDPTIDTQCGADSIIPYDIAHTIINHYATSFLMKYLMDDDRFEEYLCAGYDTFTTVWCETTTGIHSNAGQPVSQIGIDVEPNPFNSSVAITVPSGAEVEICDLRGNVVVNGCLQPTADGVRTFIWTPDETIPSGIYLVKVKPEAGRTLTKRVMYLK